MTFSKTYKLIPFLLLFIVIASSCGKKYVEPITFTTYVNNLPFTLPINNTIGTEVQLSKILTTFNIDSAVKAENPEYAASGIQAAEVSECKLTLTDGDMFNNMANMQTISLYLSSTANTNPSIVAHLPERIDQATYVFPIPKATNNVVTDYLRSNNLTFTLTGVPRRSSAKVVNGIASIGIRMKVAK
jgi:hypothetical protein